MSQQSSRRVDDGQSTRGRWPYLPQLVLFIILVAAGGAYFWWALRGDWPVRVNGTPISSAELNKVVNRTAGFLASNYGVDFSGSNGTKIKERLKREVLQQMIDKTLLLQAAARSGISVSPVEVDTQVTGDMVRSGGPQQFQSILKQEGLTSEEYRQQVKEMLLITKLEDEVTKQVTVSEEEVKKSYQQNKSKLIDPAQVKVGHILVKTEAEANQVITELNKGGDFQTLAGKYSTDPSKSQNHGILGYISEEDQNIPADFRQAAFHTPVGSYTKTPVKTSFGYHVIYILDRKPAHQSTYQEARTKLKDNLLSNKKVGYFNAYLQRLRGGASYIYH